MERLRPQSASKQKLQRELDLPKFFLIQTITPGVLLLILEAPLLYTVITIFGVNCQPICLS
ncbi:MAG: hypothetical protein DMG32_00660 [Acidobacteria bacterium]|nr:MAG: hypothetical protein DMG32_00660 [Acidobacteriota bacterium]